MWSRPRRRVAAADYQEVEETELADSRELPGGGDAPAPSPSDTPALLASEAPAPPPPGLEGLAPGAAPDWRDDIDGFSDVDTDSDEEDVTLTGLEDESFSAEALAADAALAATGGLLVDRGGEATIIDHLARANVQATLKEYERAMSEADKGDGSLADVNMFWPVLLHQNDKIDRYLAAGGRPPV